ncbi:MAG: glycosyl hydrolase family 25 [Ruminococcus sp.]|nr:glycosyl hydrolase family 25 [Ruminococcus sp.]
MKIKYVLTAIGVCALFVVNIISLYFSDAIVNKEKYSVMGVDVSHYQGVIDWEAIAEQGVGFAFIKATEGSGHVDKYSAINLDNVKDTDIYHSAYHFFSFDSAGESQAENYIEAVDKESINLPPVVDIEFYGDKFKNQPSSAETTEILKPLLERLENYYGKKPIIYTTNFVYRKYIKDKFADYPLWIRNVNSEPSFIDWTFWQYSDKGRLYGYYGTEKCIDLNVYNGSMDEFKKQLE